MREVKHGQIAHIIPVGKEWARANEEEIETAEINDIKNLMLLCGKHHRMVDVEQREIYTVSVLTDMKREHEERIAMITSILPEVKSHMLFILGRIDGSTTSAQVEDAKRAMLPGFYPALERPWQVDLNDDGLSGANPQEWLAIAKNASNRIRTMVQNTPNVEHLSVFALARIPLLVQSGKTLGDKLRVDVYQRHGETNSWAWEPDGNKLDFEEQYPNLAQEPAKEVVLKIEVSGVIRNSEIPSSLPKGLPVYSLRIKRPRLGLVRTKDQLSEFSGHYALMLELIHKRHGGKCIIHTLPAVPAAVAVELGRYHRTHHPQLQVYELQGNGGGFTFALKIAGGEDE